MHKPLVITVTKIWAAAPSWGKTNLISSLYWFLIPAPYQRFDAPSLSSSTSTRIPPLSSCGHFVFWERWLHQSSSHQIIRWKQGAARVNTDPVWEKKKRVLSVGSWEWLVNSVFSIERGSYSCFLLTDAALCSAAKTRKTLQTDRIKSLQAFHSSEKRSDKSNCSTSVLSASEISNQF